MAHANSTTVVPSVIEALRLAPGDTRVICEGGEEFNILSYIVAKRGGPAFTRFFDGTMEEGIKKVIRFPTKSINVVRAVMNYLQFDDEPRRHIETNVGIYLMADEYQIEPLKEIIMQRLMVWASSYDAAFTIYERCDHELLRSVRNKAYETICEIMQMRAKLVCGKCNGVRKIRCEECTKLMGSTTFDECPEGHEINLDKMTCNGLNGNYCGGKFKKVMCNLGIPNVSDSTIIEVIRRRYS